MKTKALDLVRNVLIVSLLVDLGVLGYAVGREIAVGSDGEPGLGVHLLLGLAGRLFLAATQRNRAISALGLRALFVCVYSGVIHVVDDLLSRPRAADKRRGIYLLTALCMSAWWRAGVLLAPGGVLQYMARPPPSVWTVVAIYATVRSLLLAVAITAALALIVTGRPSLRLDPGPLPQLAAGMPPSPETTESAASTPEVVVASR